MWLFWWNMVTRGQSESYMTKMGMNADNTAMMVHKTLVKSGQYSAGNPNNLAQQQPTANDQMYTSGMNSAILGFSAPEQPTQEFLDQQKEKIEAAIKATQLYQDAWINVWTSIGAGTNVFKSFGKAAKQVIADVARSQAKEQMAKGVGKIAEGTWPPNPLALQSAAKHFAAVALFAALGGAAGGGQGYGGGGAGGGGGQGRRNQEMNYYTNTTYDPRNTTRASGLNPAGTVNITVIGPNDPQAQRQVKQLINNATARGL